MNVVVCGKMLILRNFKIIGQEILCIVEVILLFKKLSMMCKPLYNTGEKWTYPVYEIQIVWIARLIS